MLDNLTKYVQIITVTVFLLFSIYNVGYFSPIGIHYIGLIDATNILYTFGLISIVLVWFAVVILVASLFYSAVIVNVKGEGKKLLINVGVSFMGALFSMIFSLVQNLLRGRGHADLLSVPSILWEIIVNFASSNGELIAYGSFVFIISIVLISIGISESTSFARGDGIHVRPVIFAAVAVMFLFYFSGALVSIYYVTLSPNLYTLQLKGDNRVEGKIFRSSSSGLIVVVNRNVFYYSKDQILSVESKQEFGSQ